MIDYSSGLFFMDCMIEFLEKIKEEEKSIDEAISGLKLGRAIIEKSINEQNEKKE